MLKKHFVLIAVFTVSITACARPIYEEKIVANNGQSNAESTAACDIKFKTSGNCVSWKWEKMPTSSIQGAFSFKIYRQNAYDNSAVLLDPDFMPSVVLWMPGMGHGSSPTSVKQLDVGTYMTENVFFVMPGQWQIKFQIKNGSAIVDEAIVDVEI